MADDPKPPEQNEEGDAPEELARRMQQAAIAEWDRTIGRKQRIGEERRQGRRDRFAEGQERLAEAREPPDDAPEQPQRDFRTEQGEQIGDMTFLKRVYGPDPPQSPPPAEQPEQPEQEPEPPPKAAQFPPGRDMGDPDPFAPALPGEPWTNEPPDPFEDEPAPVKPPGGQGEGIPFDAPQPPELPWERPGKEAGGGEATGEGMGDMASVATEGIALLDQIRGLLEEIKEIMPSVGALE